MYVCTCACSYAVLPLYTPSVIGMYRNRGSADLPPHVFTIADDAYNRMAEHNTGQSIVISGESGAGTHTHTHARNMHDTSTSEQRAVSVCVCRQCGC